MRNDRPEAVAFRGDQFRGVRGEPRTRALSSSMVQAAEGGAFAAASSEKTSAYFTTPVFFGRPRFFDDVVGARLANESARRRFVLATANATSIPVFTRPRTRIVPRRRFSHASFFTFPKNPSTRERRDIEENHRAEPKRSRCESGASVAWNVVNFFEHTEPGRVVAGARAAGNAPRHASGRWVTEAKRRCT